MQSLVRKVTIELARVVCADYAVDVSRGGEVRVWVDESDSAGVGVRVGEVDGGGGAEGSGADDYDRGVHLLQCPRSFLEAGKRIALL